jgi:hypothetical protein
VSSTALYALGVLNVPREASPVSFTTDFLKPRNSRLETDEWMNEIIWDARRVSPELVESDDEETRGAEEIRKTPAFLSLAASSKLDPFNLSNDHIYEQKGEARLKIRQTFGTIEVFHSRPAKILQMPFVSS